MRLVYCLGYGEDELLGSGRLSSRNGGTPQFWKVFYSCLNPVTRNEDFAPVQVSRTPLPERLFQKVRILEQLREQGVWLLDASIAALYIPGQRKPSINLIEAALTTSWDTYVGAALRTASPQAILVVGFSVARILRQRLNRLGIPWGAVPQPNARLSSQDHFAIYADYCRVCRRPETVSSLSRF